MLRLDTGRRPVLDTCGTGGDGSKTFNISTAAALVLAGTGHSVAKHGNRAITSRTGSADVLAELGIHLEAPPPVARRYLSKLGFAFVSLLSSTMQNMSGLLDSNSSSTIFNRLGPLANPAQAECQVLGVGQVELQGMAGLSQLGTMRSIVVRGEDGVDEVSISGPTRVLEVTAAEIREHRWTPQQFGIPEADRDSLIAEDPASSAQCIREVMQGEKGPRRDVVVINAAAALWLVTPEASLADCARRIESVIDSGQAQDRLVRLTKLTHS